ncbi:hypothetical protein ACFX10_022715 [Malus domestica]
MTLKIDDSNYVTWNFQMELLLDGNGILGFVYGSIPCPNKYVDSKSEDEAVENPQGINDVYTMWRIHDNALMTLTIATLSPAALSCVIGCQSLFEMWINLKERFSNMTRTSIVQMKIDLQNIKKGPESIDVYLQLIKDCRDQLAAVGVMISDEDIVIVALRGLPSEYNTIKFVIRGRENLVSLKELWSQLKAEKSTLEEVVKQAPVMTAMFANSPSSGFESGNSSGLKYSPKVSAQQAFLFQPMPPFQQLPMFQSMLVSQMSGPYACVAQNGSGTYNNFRGSNFKPKGKGKKFYSGSQSSLQQPLVTSSQSSLQPLQN